ncbi:hypothetical protein ACVNF4_21790 [Streptomyces sp. S6]
MRTLPSALAVVAAVALVASYGGGSATGSDAPAGFGEALAYVLDRARTRADRQAALDALAYKCEVLWTLLDAVDRAPA